MKITAKQGRGTKIHISIDGEYLLTVDSDFWFSCGYVSGDDINENELAAFKDAAGSRCAFNSAMYSLDLRDHSEKELRLKLMRKFDSQYVEEAINKLLELGLLDDRRFAENFAQELFTHKKYGKHRIKSELFIRGISSDIVSDVLDELFEYEDTDNVQRIVDIIRKKYYNKLNDENGRKKVFAAMTRMGYSFSDIREALHQFSDDDFYEEF